MSSPSPQSPSAQWISAYLDGTISDDDFAKLSTYLRESPAHLEELAAAAQLDEMVRDTLAQADHVDLLADEAAITQTTPSTQDTVDILDLGDFTSAESTHTSILSLMADLEPSDDEIELVDLTQTLRDRKLAKHLKLAAENRALKTAKADPPARTTVIPKSLVILGLAAAIFLGVTVFFVSPPRNTGNQSAGDTTQGSTEPVIVSLPVLATLNDSFMPRWRDSSFLGQDGKSLRAGRYELLEGAVRMTLADGTKLKVIAPVRFELDEVGEIILESGQLVADVPPDAIGFRVETPAGVIVDLGTTFGVEVIDNDVVVAEVISGLIRVAARQPDGELSGFVDVIEDGAAQLDRRAGTVQPIQAGGDRFSMDYVRVIDLVDAVAGGDGTTGLRNAGIDPQAGEWQDAPMGEVDWGRTGDHRFHRVDHCALIAGTFIPTGDGRDTQLDPAGHTFDRFTVTQSVAYGQTWAGGYVPVPGEQPELDTIIDGVNYAAPSRGLIRMHANSGLCFDLVAIREAHPGLTTARFRTGFSNREATRRSSGDADLYASVDVWVFVDGALRFTQRDITTADGMIDIDLPLTGDDQYLTVVITDALNTNTFDWVLLCQPRIDLRPRDRE